MSRMTIFLFVFIAAFYPSLSYAYLDPSSGSAIVSGIIGVIAAISFTLKTYWYKLKRLFTGKEEVVEPEADSNEDSI